MPLWAFNEDFLDVKGSVIHLHLPRIFPVETLLLLLLVFSPRHLQHSLCSPRSCSWTLPCLWAEVDAAPSVLTRTQAVLGSLAGLNAITEPATSVVGGSDLHLGMK
jgi:hypothetical protein